MRSVTSLSTHVLDTAAGAPGKGLRGVDSSCDAERAAGATD
jgi:hypothetical protein